MKAGFKFQVQHVEGDRISLKNDRDDLNYRELLELFIQFSIAAGYNESTIESNLAEYATKAQEHETLDKKE